MMTMELRMINGVERLSVARVEKYLQQAGWVKTTSVNPRVIPYEGPLDVTGTPILVVLPANKSFVDANRRINDVIRTVAAIEARSPESLVKEIARMGSRRRIVTGRTRLKLVPRPVVLQQNPA